MEWGHKRGKRIKWHSGGHRTGAKYVEGDARGVQKDWGVFADVLARDWGRYKQGINWGGMNRGVQVAKVNIEGGWTDLAKIQEYIRAYIFQLSNFKFIKFSILIKHLPPFPSIIHIPPR